MRVQKRCGDVWFDNEDVFWPEWITSCWQSPSDNLWWEKQESEDTLYVGREEEEGLQGQGTLSKRPLPPTKQYTYNINTQQSFRYVFVAPF